MMIEDLSDFEVYEARVAKQMQADEDQFFESGRLWDSLGLYDDY